MTVISDLKKDNWFNFDAVIEPCSHERAMQYFLVKLAYENYTPIKVFRTDNIVSMNMYFIHKSQSHLKSFSLLKRDAFWVLKPINDILLEELNKSLEKGTLILRDNKIFLTN